MDEFDLIARLFRPLTRGRKEALGLADDAALIEGKFAVTTDAIQEGVHFLGHEPPGLIAQKLLRVNLSDLAAMGAAPYCYFLTLGLPAYVGENWLRGFAEGLRRDQESYGLFLAGGDSTNAKAHIGLTVTALGTVGAHGVLTRGGAQPGDALYASGTIGDAALGLAICQSAAPLWGSRGGEGEDFLARRYLLPQPRVALGQALCGVASAAMDVSDGLAQDAGHLCAASGCGAVIEAARMPLSAPARQALARDSGLLACLLSGGDDYELLFTVPPERVSVLDALARRAGTPVTRIGAMIEGTGVAVLRTDGQPLTLPSGFRHRF